MTELDPRNAELNLDVFSSLTEQERLLLVSNLRCAAAQEVIFRPFEGTGQIWVDGILVYAEAGPFRLVLDEGDHTVVVVAAFIPGEARSIRISGTHIYDSADVAELHQEFVERNIRFHMAWTVPETELSSDPYKGVVERWANHWDTHELRLLDGVLSWLMQWKRVRVPQCIAYRTERGRHKRAYWLELTQVDENEEYAELYGELSKTGDLDIRAVHADEFIIHLTG
ncbi:hypothetical protein [Paenibacillus sp. NPDC055715]